MRMQKKHYSAPAKAWDIEVVLDIILQILNVLDAFARIFGINLSGLFGDDAQ